MELKKLRKQNGFTQEECAEFLNISLRTYNKYENHSDKIVESKYDLYCKKLNENLNKNLENNSLLDNINFITSVKIGNELNDFVQLVSKYKKRKCFTQIKDYLYDDNYNKVLILYGLRRTGKTTLIRQSILDMNESDRKKAAFIQITNSNNLSDLNHDLKLLMKNGFKYIFIDEVTLMNDFIEGSALLSDIFVPNGMKIVLSGTDSLGFWISHDEQLYDRCILLHTTFISYNEFKNVLGISGIDNYIRYGGTMSIDGIHYNENNLFSSENVVDEYVDSAIARNIQHSLKCYQDENHFRNLKELYEKNELTNVINRVVEDINHRFTIDVLTKDFISHDLGISARNLRKDRNNPTDILDNINVETFTQRLKEAFEILNKNEQNIEIKDIHKEEIKEYLYALDIIKEIDLEFLPTSNVKNSLTVITQPGLRYSQAKILIEKLMMDKVFEDISARERKLITERILNEIKGRMMEEIVLLETMIAKKDKKVFKLQFAVGEFDMVVVDSKNITCEIYEIKHSTEIINEQQRHLLDDKKCKDTEFRFGKITNKYVIYRGEDKTLDNGIKYLNVENYLENL